MELAGHEEVCLMLIPSMNFWTFEPAMKAHPNLYFLPTMATKPSASVLFTLKEDNLFHQPASFLCIEDQIEVWTLGLPCLHRSISWLFSSVSRYGGDQSFLNWSSHHVRQPIRKVYFVTTCYFYISKLWHFWSSLEHNLSSFLKLCLLDCNHLLKQVIFILYYKLNLFGTNYIHM